MLPTYSPIWRARDDSLGQLQDVELIGTIAPAGADRTLETYARLRFVDAAETVALYRSPDRGLVGLANENPRIRPH